MAPLGLQEALARSVTTAHAKTDSVDQVEPLRVETQAAKAAAADATIIEVVQAPLASVRKEVALLVPEERAAPPAVARLLGFAIQIALHRFLLQA